MGNMRLISRDAAERSGTLRVPRADRDNCFAADLMAARVSRYAGRFRWSNGPDGLRWSFGRGRAMCGQCDAKFFARPAREARQIKAYC
jgi:hypothetical protein